MSADKYPSIFEAIVCVVKIYNKEIVMIHFVVKYSILSIVCLLMCLKPKRCSQFDLYITIFYFEIFSFSQK